MNERLSSEATQTGLLFLFFIASPWDPGQTKGLGLLSVTGLLDKPVRRPGPESEFLQFLELSAGPAGAGE